MCSCPESAPPCESKRVRRLSGRLESSNVAIAPQAANLVGGEGFSRRGFGSLPVQNSGDDFIRIKRGQTAEQRGRLFGGAWSHRPESWDRDIQHSNRAAAPTQSELSVTFGTLEIQDDFVQQRAQQFLAIPVGGGGRVPNSKDIGADNRNAFDLLGTERVGPLLLTTAQFHFR